MVAYLFVTPLLDTVRNGTKVKTRSKITADVLEKSDVMMCNFSESPKSRPQFLFKPLKKTNRYPHISLPSALNELDILNQSPKIREL